MMLMLMLIVRIMAPIMVLKKCIVNCGFLKVTL